MSAVETLPSLHGMPTSTAERTLARDGFRFTAKTGGGYRRYDHPDGSVVWFRPDGEVIRLGPRIPSASGKKFAPRYDQHGKRTELHSTGERVVMGR